MSRNVFIFLAADISLLPLGAAIRAELVPYSGSVSAESSTAASHKKFTRLVTLATLLALAE
jgi:hypothetical protein